MSLIPCQNCQREFSPSGPWNQCEKCGFRICPPCVSKHSGKYSSGGFKCSRCAFGIIKPSR